MFNICHCADPEKLIRGLNEAWIIGDSFMAKSYRLHFLLNPNLKHENSFIHSNYEVRNQCNSRYTSASTNLLQRLQNTFAMALNKRKNEPLPKYWIVVLDDDVISFLNYTGEGVSELYREMLTWLVDQLITLIQDKKKLLPSRAQAADEPFIYWVAAPIHQKFTADRNELRIKFNKCLESILKITPGMRLIKFKDNWPVKDSSLVSNDKFTERGMDMYWRAIDASFKFNIERRELFLARKLIAINNQEIASKRADSEDTRRGKIAQGSSRTAREDEDDVIQFFNRHSENQSSRSKQEDARMKILSNKAKFILPRPKPRNH